jgi:hypothetical protein
MRTMSHPLRRKTVVTARPNLACRILRGLGFSSVLLPAGIVLANALAFFGLALWRFTFEKHGANQVTERKLRGMR